MHPQIETQPFNPSFEVPEATRKLKSYILEQLPPLPDWVLERRWKAEKDALYVSDMLDITHRDNPHVKLGNVPRVHSYDKNGAPKPIWYEVGFPWEFAVEKFGKEACHYFQTTDWKYIIQRPTT